MIQVLVAALLAAASASDTVTTVDGGRVVGIILEESPSSGVTIQAPDGSVRRIPAGQVARVDFSDGTSSGPRPAAPTPAPAAVPVVVPPPGGPPDTVYFTGGGRVRGSVIQEDPRTGVKLRLLDGSLRTYGPDEFSRIEYADGTVSRRKPPEPAAAPPPPPPAVAPPAPAAEARLDTVFFLAGGRVRGTVIEEHPATGVRIRQLDGSLHTYSRDELTRIEYSDGTVSRRKSPPAPSEPPPAQPSAMAPPPMHQPPPPSSPPPEDRSHLFPLYLTLGVGISSFGGEAERSVSMPRIFDTQGHLSSEIGLRLSPSFALGVYGDVGGGDVGSAIRDQCLTQGLNCMGATAHAGFLLRHTWAPLSHSPTWITIGTGWEAGSVSENRHQQSNELFTYTGRELVRLGAGIDFRSNRVLGFGFYGSFSWGEYDQYKDPSGTASLQHRTHTTGQVGVRLTLFP